jgi:hypothetical protein
MHLHAMPHRPLRESKRTREQRHTDRRVFLRSRMTGRSTADVDPLLQQHQLIEDVTDQGEHVAPLWIEFAQRICRQRKTLNVSLHGSSLHRGSAPFSPPATCRPHISGLTSGASCWSYREPATIQVRLSEASKKLTVANVRWPAPARRQHALNVSCNTHRRLRTPGGAAQPSTSPQRRIRTQHVHRQVDERTHLPRRAPPLVVHHVHGQRCRFEAPPARPAVRRCAHAPPPGSSAAA